MNHLIKQLHWCIFAIGGMITGWATVYVDRQIERKAQDSFNLRVQDMEATLAKRLRSYEDILYGVAGLYHATNGVTPEQFDSYGESLNIKERFPALDTINFGQYFSRNEREKFIRNYSADTHDRGDKPTLLADRDEHMVLTRVYPAAMLPTLGTDLFKTMRRRLENSGNTEHIVRSGDYLPNQVHSSGVPLLPKGRNSPGLAARLGIFTPQFIGTAGIGFNILSFFKEAIPESLAKTLHYKMTNIGRSDGVRYATPINMFDSRSIRTGIDPAQFLDKDLLKKHFDIPFGGALLRIEVTERRDANIEQYEQYLPVTVFVSGLLFFAGIALSSRRMLSDNAALNRRTIELQCEVNRTKSLERELAVVIESERTRIGRELHDDLGQRLTGISVSAEILATKLLVIDPALARHADDLGQATSDAMGQLRALAHGLMPVASDKEGLRDALTDLTVGVSRLSDIHCSFDFDDPVDVLDDSTAAHLYRIAQEAVNNAIRHAHAGTIDVRLDEVDGKIMLSIADDGCGFDQTYSAGGLGLSTIAHRAAIIGYNLQIISATGRGTTIKVIEC